VDKFKKYRPVKFLGQNFLVDENIAKKIVKSLEINDGDLIIEIGAGYGALTKYIINQTNKYIGIEIDEKCINALKEKFGDKIIFLKKNFLEFDFKNDVRRFQIKFQTIKIIGNIPYNITSEILFKLFENKFYIHSAVIMTQKEVAQRLNAKPKTKQYGILTVHTQLNAYYKNLFTLPPTVFFPKPKVESSVFKLMFHDKYNINEPEHFSTFIKIAFGKRRKTLKNCLKDYIQSYKIDLINYDFSCRAEELSPVELLDLYNTLERLKLK